MVTVIVAAFVVPETPDTTQVADSTFNRDDIAAPHAEFVNAVPSASIVTSWPTILMVHNPANVPLPTFVVIVKTKLLPVVNGSSPFGHNLLVQSNPPQPQSHTQPWITSLSQPVYAGPEPSPIVPSVVSAPCKIPAS